ncbi:uncharacterized protein LOC107041187 [Diachasma alloeum]|uniref:uncharacterized protein LOC107041187 n=1 Tax=Diachasma alloeum TaxID=454923 RepID=UPI00073811C6|nr:uncharacterized protein LOC107041187 [Diachasma alloeum]
MLFESASNNNNQMSDEELDEAVASHLKKLDTLEIMEKLLENAKLHQPDSTPPNEPACSDSVTSGDWADAPKSWLTNPRIFTREMLNLSSLFGAPEWKSKNVYSISNPGPLQPKKFSIQPSEKSEEPEKENPTFLVRTRDYLADYQESQGIPRNEYCFGSLLKVMGQATGKSFLALFFILVNIAPMTQILLFVSRFILDKAVGILSSKDTQQKATKSAIFGLQLISIYICLFFIFGSIWLPILQMVFGIISQILFFN